LHGGEVHHHKHRRLGMKRTVAQLSLAAVLVTVGGPVQAADPVDAPTAADVTFNMLVDVSSNHGEFTPIGDIPQGTFEITDTMFDPETGNVTATYVLDPAPQGGDTFTIQTVGKRVGEFSSGAFFARTDWSVIEAMGDYKALAGSHGRAYPVSDMDQTWRVVTLVPEAWAITA
jgi:hypothetical protein